MLDERFFNAKATGRFWNSVDKTGDCWHFTHDLNSQGYGRFCVGNKKFLAHRYSFMVINARLPNDQVLHRCDKPTCVRPEHLFEGSQRDNMIDRALKGKQNTGKLNAEQVKEIFRRRGQGEILRTIARDFGVTCSTVWDIGRGKTWPTLTARDA